MSNVIFKYCPLCGEQIPQNTMAKYCPFCGGKFLLSADKTQDLQENERLIIQDQLSQEEMSLSHNDHMEINIDNYNKMSRRKPLESEYYSIILKDALNKQELVHKLEKELLRGSFAIRLAVDTIPNIIIYKAKSRDTLNLKKIFNEEQASISVIAGDFNDKPIVEDLFSTFSKFSSQTKQIIKKMPINLWLGDRIHTTFPQTYREQQEGVMVISDQNIYFVPSKISSLTYRWFVRSYNLLSKVIIQENCLEFSYHDTKVTSIAFADKQKMMDAYQSILHALQGYKE